MALEDSLLYVSRVSVRFVCQDEMYEFFYACSRDA